jgi:hypothetical protein
LTPRIYFTGIASGKHLNDRNLGVLGHASLEKKVSELSQEDIQYLSAGLQIRPAPS